MPCYALEGVIPVVDPTAYVHPTAVLIGDVLVGPGCYVGPGAVMRGDFGRLELHEGANLQDNCVMHGFPGRPTVVEADGHVGHGAVLHSCTVRRGALVGMNAVVMDEAEVGEQAIVGACALVPAGMKVPARALAGGMPARVIRELKQQEIDWKAAGTGVYQDLTLRCRSGLVECEPLAAIEADRPRLKTPPVQPLVAVKRGDQAPSPQPENPLP